MTENESEKSSVKFELNDNDDMSDEIKKELNKTGEVHLHKTGNDGEEVDIESKIEDALNAGIELLRLTQIIKA